MAYLKITMKLEGEEQKTIDFLPSMRKVTYGLPNSTPLMFLPYSKLSNSILTKFIRKQGLDPNDPSSLMRVFLITRYLSQLSKTTASSVSPETVNGNIKMILDLFFSKGSKLYIGNTTYVIQTRTWDGEFTENKARSPPTRSTKRSSTSRSSTSRSPFKSIGKGGSSKSKTMKAGSYVANKTTGINAVYKINIIVGVTKGGSEPSLLRRSKVSCQQKRKALRESIKQVLGFDIGDSKSLVKPSSQHAPQMFSNEATTLRKPRQARSRTPPYPYPFPYSYASSKPGSSSKYPSSPYYPYSYAPVPPSAPYAPYYAPSYAPSAPTYPVPSAPPYVGPYVQSPSATGRSSPKK